MTVRNGTRNATHAPAGLPPGRTLRGIKLDAELLCVWALCERAACRRSRSCCSTGENCVRKYAGLVPLMARAWLLRLMWNKEQGRTFEEAMEEIAGSDEEQAFVAWRETAAAVSRKPRGRKNEAATAKAAAEPGGAGRAERRSRAGVSR